MKTTMKIAVIAMMGMSLGVSAQDETINGNLTVQGSLKIRKLDNTGTAGFDLSGTGTYIHLAGDGLIARNNNKQDLGLSSWRFRNLWLGNNAYISGKTTSNSFLLRRSDGSGTAGLALSGTGTYIHLYGDGLIGSNNKQDLGISNYRFRNLYLGNNAYIGNSIAIGTTDTKGFELGVNGKIAANEVKVATYPNWPDFVFENNYDIPTLKEVESHIKEKGHLKDIPSAKEVKKMVSFLEQWTLSYCRKLRN